jgi:hypothetical protein
LHGAFREHCRVQHPKRDRVSFPRRRRSLFIESAEHDLVEGIPAFWTDKSIARVGDQIFKAFLMICAFALIANVIP